METVLFAFGTSRHMLYTREERKEKLASMGVDVLIDCPLDEHIRHMRAEDFVTQILVDRLHARYLAVGRDFRFDAGRERKVRLPCRKWRFPWGFRIYLG